MPSPLAPQKGGNVFSPFLLILAVIVGIAFIFLTLKAAQLAQDGDIQQGVQVGMSALTLFGFVMFGFFFILLGQLFPNDTPRLVGSGSVFDNAKDFVAGFALFFLVTELSKTFSVFQFAVLASTSNIFAQTSTILSGFWGYYLTVLGAPIAEEFMFFVALPAAILTLMTGLSKVGVLRPVTGNKIVQTGVVLAVVPAVFAAFHVNQAGLVAFFIAAVVFRSLLLIFQTDVRFNTIKGLTTGLMFAIGAHIANNIQTNGGLARFFSTLLQPSADLFQVISGFMVVVVFALIFVVFVLGLATFQYFKRRARA